MPNSLTKHTTGPVVFDLETNGLIHDATRIHCMALYWCQDDLMETYNDEPYAPEVSPADKKYLPMASRDSITTALGFLEVADAIVGHNIIGFDIPIIKKFYPWFNPSGVIVDTLLLSRLYHPNLFDIDNPYKNQGYRKKGDNERITKWDHMPLQLYGRHSLEAYGHRLGEYKGNFAKTTDWKKWSQEMQDYCVQDVVVTNKLWKHFHPYLDGSKPKPRLPKS